MNTTSQRVNYLKNDRNYTDKQLKFLEAFSKHQDIRKAAKESNYQNGFTVVESLKEEIITISENFLAYNASKAVDTIVSALDADGVPHLTQRLDAAKTLLDRIGIVKKDKLEIEANVHGGIFVLPAKD
jgi:hypothetical protein